MARSEPSAKVPVRKGMRKFVVRIIRPGVVPHPPIVCFYVRRVRVPWLIAEVAIRRRRLLRAAISHRRLLVPMIRGIGWAPVFLATRGGPARRRRSMGRNVSSAHSAVPTLISLALLTTFISSVLRNCRKRNQ